MEGPIRRLPDAELEIMLIIWKTGEPVHAAYILDRLKNQRKWPLSTLLTVLARLTEKGFLICEKEGRNNKYTAAVSERQYKESEGKSTLMKLFGNSVQDLVLSLYNGKAITKQDLAELRQLIDQVEQEGAE